MVEAASLSGLFFEHVGTRYRPLRHARELLARAAAVTPNAARNWLRGECAPQADSLGDLMRNDPEFRARVAAWIAAISHKVVAEREKATASTQAAPEREHPRSHA